MNIIGRWVVVEAVMGLLTLVLAFLVRFLRARSHRRVNIAGRWVVLVVGVVLLAGCAAWSEQTTGAPFLTPSDDVQGDLDRLGRQILTETSIEDVRRLLTSRIPTALPPHSQWSGHYTPGLAVEVYTWRFAVIARTRWALGVYQASDVTTRGYALTVRLRDGRPVATEVEVTRLTSGEREFLTHHLVSVGAAAVGTLLILGAP